jgi:hypothetical protein
MVTGLVLVLSLMLTASEESAPWPIASAVRSSSTSIRALLVEGVRDSGTFKRLVDTLDASDGIVYVEAGRCRRGADRLNACLVNDVAAAGGRRYLRILVDLRKDPVDLTGSIGHEIQHAVEVLSDRSVTSMASMLAFYQGDGRNGARSYETEAAVDAGLSVAREISASRKQMVIAQRPRSDSAPR